jgi:hypothetical protein
MHNILKRIGQLRSPYIGMTVSGSKLNESPRSKRYTVTNLRSVNSNKNFESGSPTNDQNMLMFSSSHLPSYPPFPLQPFEEPGYYHNNPALRAALFEQREHMHGSRYPFSRHPESAGLVQHLQLKHMKPAYTLPSQQYAAGLTHHRPRPGTLKEALANFQPEAESQYPPYMFMRGGY